MERSILTRRGIPVYFYPNLHLHGFCLCMYGKAGCMYEAKRENGISHFFEHAVIRNINSLMDGGFYQTLDRLGLSFNGSTYKEFVQFSISGASSHWKEAAELFVKLFDPLILSDEEIETERKRIKAEIREEDDKNSVSRRMERAVWKGTSLARTIAGKGKILDGIGRRELEAFREAFFSRGNLFFYVTGHCEEGDLEFLADLLREKALTRKTEKRRNLAPVPKHFFKRKPEPVFVSSSYTRVGIAFDVDTSRYTDAMLSLFYDLLFEGDYCRIYQELSEKTGYIYSYDSLFERYKNIGSLQVHYEVTPGKLFKAFDKTLEIFEAMKQSPGSLEYVRAPYVDNGEMVLDDADDFNWNRAYDCHILDEDYPDIESRKRDFMAVTKEDMARMAEDIFRPENMTVVIKGHKKKVPKKKIKKRMKKLGVCNIIKPSDNEKTPG